MNKIHSTLRRFYLPAFLTCTLISVCAFNSQEHKILGDVGISRVNLPASLQFQNGIGFTKNFNYLEGWKHAKNLAVGFDNNDDAKYSQFNYKVQDNCYWTGYGQRSFNMINYIESSNRFPESLFQVQAYVGESRHNFSFGDLVALYGDYRRTVYSKNGDCYLTAPEHNKINFSGNNILSGYCPDETTTVNYLQSIAYGLVPPYGSAGNTTKNTAGSMGFDDAGWWGDEMIRLASANESHFSNTAIAWYTGMHRLALLYAQKAIKDPNYWNQALHYEASALHSLTDLFAFGHVVTNVDQRSNAVMVDNNLLSSKPYQWMQNVIKMGGGQRTEGIINLSATNLPVISDLTTLQNDFIPSDLSIAPTKSLPRLGSTSVWGKNEHTYHDYFNETGGTVRNLKGDRFFILGDGKLHSLSTGDRKIIEDAVTTSVQSLVDAYETMLNGITPDEIGKPGSSFFKALLYVPVFIESDENNYFKGMWTPYADAVKSITGSTKEIKNWNTCQIPFLTGKDIFWPTKLSSPCTTF